MDGGAEELRQWELERNSWWLLRDLFIARLNSRAIVGGSDGGQADAAVVVYDGTDRQLVAEFQSNDPAVVEHVVGGSVKGYAIVILAHLVVPAYPFDALDA